MSSRALAAVDALVEEYLVYRGFTEVCVRVCVRRMSGKSDLLRASINLIERGVPAVMCVRLDAHRCVPYPLTDARVAAQGGSGG